VRDLNRLLCAEPALHELDFDARGFEWIDCNDADHSVVSFERRGKDPADRIAAVFNFTPVPRHGYLVGVDGDTDWEEIANSDAGVYGGSGVGNLGRAVSLAVPVHGRSHSLALSLPPLWALFLKPLRRLSLRAAGRESRCPEEEEEAESALSGVVMDASAKGHFYQPPRENPWLEAIESQDSAYPYHDWNERITAECYAPNATARILDGENRIIAIVNNYASMSFNFGPTLLSWLDRDRTSTGVLEADPGAPAVLGPRLGAAQPYNHMILPLAGATATQISGDPDFSTLREAPEGCSS
jgi:hypothetical protein